jgi:hypothetical protein
VGTAQHNAFNCTPLAVLNVARDSMAEVGFSPATRVFEATGDPEAFTALAARFLGPVVTGVHAPSRSSH